VAYVTPRRRSHPESLPSPQVLRTNPSTHGLAKTMVPPKLNPPEWKRPPPLQSVDDDERDSETTPGSLRDTAVEKMAPYPHKQLLILAACRFSEPVAMTSSFPYLFFMIRDFHLSDDEKDIGHYAGLLASSFSLAQFFSGLSYRLFIGTGF